MENAADVEFELSRSDKQTVSQKGNFGDGISLITIAQTAGESFNVRRCRQSGCRPHPNLFHKKGYITEADIVLNPYQQFSTDGTFGLSTLKRR